jgi:hypothetical protein
MRAMANLAMRMTVILFVFGVLAFPSTETNAGNCNYLPCICAGCDKMMGGSCNSFFDSLPTCFSSCECQFDGTQYCCTFAF